MRKTGIALALALASTLTLGAMIPATVQANAEESHSMDFEITQVKQTLSNAKSGCTIEGGERVGENIGCVAEDPTLYRLTKGKDGFWNSAKYVSFAAEGMPSHLEFTHLGDYAERTYSEFRFDIDDVHNVKYISIEYKFTPTADSEVVQALNVKVQAQTSYFNYPQEVTEDVVGDSVIYNVTASREAIEGHYGSMTAYPFLFGQEVINNVGASHVDGYEDFSVLKEDGEWHTLEFRLNGYDDELTHFLINAHIDGELCVRNLVVEGANDNEGHALNYYTITDLYTTQDMGAGVYRPNFAKYGYDYSNMGDEKPTVHSQTMFTAMIDFSETLKQTQYGDYTGHYGLCMKLFYVDEEHPYILMYVDPYLTWCNLTVRYVGEEGQTCLFETTIKNLDKPLPLGIMVKYEDWHGEPTASFWVTIGNEVNRTGVLDFDLLNQTGIFVSDIFWDSASLFNAYSPELYTEFTPLTLEGFNAEVKKIDTGAPEETPSETPEEAPKKEEAPAAPAQTRDWKKIWIIVGASAGGVLLLVIIICVSVSAAKKKRAEEERRRRAQTARRRKARRK